MFPCGASLLVLLLRLLFLHAGRAVDTVEAAGSRESHSLTGLTADTEYIVTVIPIYETSTEGPATTARFKIGTVQNWY